jgi:hypothetical protein
VLSLNHSLHRPVTTAKGFYACYAGLMAIAAALVLTPGVPLGLLTEGVQTLAGVLLPSAAVFLLLLCNDKAVLGPWVNSKKLNVFTAAVIWVLVLLSIILTASVLFPDITGTQIETVLGGEWHLGRWSACMSLPAGTGQGQPLRTCWRSRRATRGGCLP